MNPYIGIVDHEPGTAYGISFPDAPGCFSAADDLADVFSVAEEALNAWTEAVLDGDGRPPRTRDLARLRADPTLAEDFGDAAFVIRSPPRRA